jgi:phosphate-selective porin OprO/OprP
MNNSTNVAPGHGVVRDQGFHSNELGSRISAYFFSAIILTSASAAAVPALEPEPSSYDKIWRYAEWYESDDNPVIQRFSFTGRFQLDYALVDADQGHHDEWNIRRFRLGGDAKLFRGFTLHGEVDLNPQGPDPVYRRLTDLYLAWSRSQDFRIAMGKHSAPFTMDGSTSSRELIATDRSNLANNLWFPQEYIPGVSVSGWPGPWRYWAGVYSSGAANEEFGEFNGGAFVLGMVGYDFGKLMHVKQAVLAGDYVYNEPDINNSFTRSLHHVGSLNFSFDTGKWGCRTDLAGGIGYLGQSDLWGTMLMPFYNIASNFQAVARWTYLKGEQVNSVRLAAYENIVVPGRGDEYNEFRGATRRDERPRRRWGRLLGVGLDHRLAYLLVGGPRVSRESSRTFQCASVAGHEGLQPMGNSIHSFP